MFKKTPKLVIKTEGDVCPQQLTAGLQKVRHFAEVPKVIGPEQGPDIIVVCPKTNAEETFRRAGVPVAVWHGPDKCPVIHGLKDVIPLRDGILEVFRSKFEPRPYLAF